MTLPKSPPKSIPLLVPSSERSYRLALKSIKSWNIWGYRKDTIMLESSCRECPGPKGVPICEIYTIPRSFFLREIGDPSPPPNREVALYGNSTWCRLAQNTPEPCFLDLGSAYYTEGCCCEHFWGGREYIWVETTFRARPIAHHTWWVTMLGSVGAIKLAITLPNLAIMCISLTQQCLHRSPSDE